MKLAGYSTLKRMRETLILRSSSGIPARGLQPLVKLILIQDPSSARLGGWDGAVLQFHVHRSPGDVRVLDGLFHSHWLMAVLLYGFTTLYLLSGQHGSHAHHLIPKLGDDLRKVVECQFCILHIFGGLCLETGAKELNDIPVLMETYGNS